MSQRDSGYERKERDLYETPDWVTETLVRDLLPRKFSCIWEPAMGSGQMWKVLATHWKCVGTDIATGDDFLFYAKPPGWGAVDAIITNPPYNLDVQFVEEALQLMEPIGGLVAMLLRVDFDSAKTRSHLFRDCPAWAKKIVLTKRIVWFVEENGKPKSSPSENHAWFVWSWKHEGPPTIGYGP